MSRISISKVSVLAFGLFILQASSVSAVESSDVSASVQFDRPLKLNELRQVLNTDSYRVLELHFSHGEIQGGYSIQSDETLDEAFRQLTLSHLDFLEVAINEDDSSNNLEDLKRDKKFKSELNKSLVLTRESEFSVDSVELITDESSLKNLESKVEVRSVHSNSVSKSEPLQLAATAYYVAPRLWYPTKGSTKTDKGLAYNSFYFADASGFDFFGGILTYEHETQVYNVNFANYAGYWSSNLPNAYYDTPFGDRDVDVFTVGSSNASKIVANTKYYTSMSLKSGSASSATVRIKGQLGHRYPSGCYSTWCIFADMTTPTLKSYTAPVSTQLSWTYTP